MTELTSELEKKMNKLPTGAGWLIGFAISLIIIFLIIFIVKSPFIIVELIMSVPLAIGIGIAVGIFLEWNAMTSKQRVISLLSSIFGLAAFVLAIILYFATHV